MTLDRAPWDTPSPPLTSTPPPLGNNQLADIERFMSMAEGFMDRFYPKFEKFLTGFQAAKEGRSKEQVNAVESQGQTLEQNTPSQPPAVTSETVYGMIFDMLNLVPDEMTCGEMRVHLRDNRELILGALKDKLGA